MDCDSHSEVKNCILTLINGSHLPIDLFLLDLGHFIGPRHSPRPSVRPLCIQVRARRPCSSFTSLIKTCSQGCSETIISQGEAMEQQEEPGPQVQRLIPQPHSLHAKNIRPSVLVPTLLCTRGILQPLSSTPHLLKQLSDLRGGSIGSHQPATFDLVSAPPPPSTNRDLLGHALP